MSECMDIAGSTSTLLARYAAGVLPTPATAFVRAHLDLKSDRCGLVQDFEHMCGTALDRIEPVSLSDKKLNLEAIFASAEPDFADSGASSETNQKALEIIPAALRDYVSVDAKDIPWKTKLPGFKEYEIGTIEGCEISMFWIKAGRAIPRHTHEGTELFMVLDGSFTDEIGHYARGDISIADETVDHRPVAGKEGPCIGFSITDAPLKLTGSIYQRIGDLLG